MLEYQEHQHATFATLTLDDSHLVGSLSTRSLSLFHKRLRKAGRRFRHLSSGEYGERNGRPHYHSILYGLSARSDEGAIDRAWGNGGVKVLKAEPGSIAYTAGYTSKKLDDARLEDVEYIDYSTGELLTWKAPFLQMSRRPGIGGSARQFANSWRNFGVLNGRKIPVPRYYHAAWKASASPQQLEELKREQQELQRLTDVTWARLEAAEVILQAAQQLKADRRHL